MPSINKDILKIAFLGRQNDKFRDILKVEVIKTDTKKEMSVKQQRA